MMLFVHGAAGGWDELIIAAVALAVLWLAVKLAGRKPAETDDEQDATPDPRDAAPEGSGAASGEALAEVDARPKTPAPPRATKPG
jgi:hypothetical protein